MISITIDSNGQIIGPDTICYNQEYKYDILFDEANAVSWSWWLEKNYNSFSIDFEEHSVIITSDSTFNEPTKIVLDLTDWTTGMYYEKIIFVTPLYEDKLVFPFDICDEDGPTVDLTTLTHLEIDKYVCQGDSTIIELRYFLEENLYSALAPTEVFTPERLYLSNAELISYDDEQIKVGWNELGRQDLVLTTNGFSDCDESQFRVSVIVLEKTKIPIISDLGTGLNIEACRNENIRLEAGMTSSNFKKWQLSDGRVFYGNSIDISFEESGVYEITLLDESECNCVEPSSIFVTIDSGPTPNIECIGTVCEGVEAYYYSSTICDSYLWSVGPEGTITEGGAVDDYFIKVLWNSAPVGELALETPNCFSDPCSELITKSIPILGPNNPITGASEVCFGEIATYSTIAYAGTEYAWNVSSQGKIIQGAGTNAIIVEWGYPETQNAIATVSLDYNNCSLECGGHSSYDVKLSPPLIINCLNSILCKNSLLNCSTDYNISVDWKIINPLGEQLAIVNSDSISIDLTEVGVYEIEVLDVYNNSCNNQFQHSIEVLPDPSIPTELIENTPVCEGVLGVYSIENIGVFEKVHWTVYDGDLLSPVLIKSSKSLIYEWRTSGPYMIDAYIENTLTGCVGVAESFNLVNNQEVVGEQNVCFGEISSFYLSDGASQIVDWKIIPPTAGNIISNKRDSVEIIWTDSGLFKVEAITCNVTMEIDVEVNPELTMSLEYPISCPGGNNQLSGIISNDATIKVFNANQVEVGNALPLTLTEGVYSVHVSNEIGCVIIETVEIEIFDVPSVRVSSPDPNVYCTINSPINLIVDTDGTLMFEWFYNNSSLGLSDISIDVNDFGSYYVVVTDENGCSSQSNTHFIIQDCLTSQPNSVSFFYNRFDCDSLDFEIQVPYSSTSFQWNFGDPESGLENIKEGFKVSHEFTRAGYYYVQAVGNLDNEVASEIIRIPVVAKFEEIEGCVNESLQFNNTTSYIDGFDDDNYLWDFGDPASGIENTSSLKHPFHQYALPGDYLVTLISTDKDGCISKAEQIITIHPRPEIPFYFVILDCISLNMHFGLIETSLLDSYTWTIDDLQFNNIVLKGPLAFHHFSTEGDYPVTLSVTNLLGCTSEESFVVKVRENDLTGEILGDISIPKCPQDSVLLTAPLGGKNYIWSTGETTNSIKVLNDGVYSVTITNESDCEYIPPPFQVASFDVYDPIIFAIKDSNELELQNIYFDSIEICEGDPFHLMINEIEGVEITWSNGKKEFELNYDENFDALSPGRYEYSVEVYDSLSGCQITNGPFDIIIEKRPEVPVIETNQIASCEGEIHIIKIKNKEQNVVYQWQDGSIQDSIITQDPGIYYVNAINSNGCISVSNQIEIYSLPNALGWMGGCREVCFPSELCLILDTLNSYNLLKEDSIVSALDPFADGLILNEPGDYSLEVVSANGCINYTDVLSLSAESIDQAIEGQVYYDENMNGVFDGIDEFLDGIEVNLMSGNTVISTTLTEQGGNYIFNDFPGVNHYLAINLSGTDYELIESIDTFLVFQFCIQDEKLDFPLITNCKSTVSKIDTFVCPGGFINFEGEEYSEFAKDTFLYNIAQGCDSTLILEVIPHPEPQLEWIVFGSCSNVNNGILEIINSDSLIQFSIDGGMRFSDTYIEDLSAGDHTLFVHDLFNCEFPIEFNIEEFIIPIVRLSTKVNCNESLGGSLEIEVIEGEQLQFRIDGGVAFSETYMEGLSAGDHTLYISDIHNCVFSVEFGIEEFIEPEILITTAVNCDETEEGSISIEIIEGDQLEFNIDGGVAFSETYMEGLSPGDHILYISDIHNCEFSVEFNIEEIIEPEILITTSVNCDETGEGSISIEIIQGDQLEFSLDGDTLFRQETIYDGLEGGDHVLIVRDENGCTFESLFNIIPIVLPSFSIETKSSCELQDNGSLIVDVLSGEVEFSLNDTLDFNNDLLFDFLPPGPYTLFSLSEEGCLDSLSFSIEEFVMPLLELETTPNCELNNLGRLLISTNESGITYSLNGLDYVNDVQFDSLEVGEYTLYYKSANDCVFEMPFEIDNILAPIINIETIPSCKDNMNGQALLNILEGDSLTFSIDGLTYQDDLIFSNLESSDYTLYVLNEADCLYEYLFEISESAGPSIDLQSEDSCPNINNGKLELFLQNDSDLVAINNGELSSNTIYENLEPGIYTVSIIDSLFCRNEMEFEIMEQPELLVELPQFSSECNDEPITIAPSIQSFNGAVQYIWSDGTTLPNFSTFEDGHYELTITDDCQEQFFSWDLQFNQLDHNHMIYVPNVFSENADQFNDCFKIGFHPELEIISYSILIYDRWGNKMFTSEDIQACWDGRYRGVKVEQGVYVYVINTTVLECDGEYELKRVGDVTVFR